MVFCQLSRDVIGDENSKCHCVSIHLLSQFNSRCGSQIVSSLFWHINMSFYQMQYCYGKCR